MRPILIAGNWKMNKSLVEARELITDLRARMENDSPADVLICPPCHLLFPMAKAVADCKIMLGAQNVHEEVSGAFTGEVSAPMLAETGCTHVIVGHSERRHIFGETGTRLAAKVRAVIAAGMTAIYCVGETLDQREAGETETVVKTQIDEAIRADIPADRLIIAYEPVWAIGTGKNATPEIAQEVHGLIRRRIGEIYDSATAETVLILYGGSVKPSNARSLLGQKDIDGALVGGASLVAEDFHAIMVSSAQPASS